MRKFSTEEQRIILQLVNGASSSQPYLPINLFNDIFQSGDVGFDYKKSSLFFKLNNRQKPSVGFMLGVYNVILERVMLLDYLQSEGLVYIVHMATSTNTSYAIGLNGNSNPVVQHSIEPSIARSLLKFINDPIYVGETLKAYVDSDFRSIDELSLDEAKKQTAESKCQTYLSLFAVAISFVALILSFLQNCSGGSGSTTINDNDTTGMTIPVGVMFNKLDAKLDATMNNTANIHAKLCDTINVRFTKDIKPNPDPAPTKRIPTVNTTPQQDLCTRKVFIDTCNDTIVPKSLVKGR